MYTATVTLIGRSWQVQVATTQAELTQGLSGVASIPAQTGMLFDLGSERVVTVNAYEMLFPLSLVFIGEDLKITGAILSFTPGDVYTTSTPCRYFLEVNGGEVDDIALEDAVTIIGYTPATSGGIDLSSLMNLMITMMIVTMMMKMMMNTMKGA